MVAFIDAEQCLLPIFLMISSSMKVHGFMSWYPFQKPRALLNVRLDLATENDLCGLYGPSATFGWLWP